MQICSIFSWDERLKTCTAKPKFSNMGISVRCNRKQEEKYIRLVTSAYSLNFLKVCHSVSRPVSAWKCWTHIYQVRRESYWCVLRRRLPKSEPSASHPFHSWRNFHSITGQCSGSPSVRHSEVFVSAHTSFHSTVVMAIQQSLPQSGRQRSLGVLQRRVYHTRINCMTTLNSVLLKSRIILTTESSSELFDSGVFDCVRVFVKTVATLGTCCTCE